MNKLMDANLFRLKRDKVFWACFAILLCAGAGIMANGVRQCRALAAEGYTVALAGVGFRLAPAVGLALAVFAGLFLGTDHSEGALRNRLMVGHSRERVYLAGLGAAVTAAFALTAAWLLGSAVLALPNRDLWQMGAGQTVLLVLVALGSALSLASILTVVGMLTEKKSTAAVVSILLVLGLLLASTWLYARLQEPEMNTGLILTTQGMEWGDPTPNPRYVSGTLRQVFRLLLDVLPTGQAVLLADLATARPVFQLGASLTVTAVTTLLGLALFRKKDLK